MIEDIINYIAQLPSALIGAVGTVVGAVLGWRGRLFVSKQNLGQYTRREAQLVVKPWAKLIASAEYVLVEGVPLDKQQLHAVYIAVDEIAPKVRSDIRERMYSLRESLGKSSTVDTEDINKLRENLLNFCKTYSMVTKNAEKKRNI